MPRLTKPFVTTRVIDAVEQHGRDRMSTIPLQSRQPISPAVARLSALAPLDAEALLALERSISASVTDRAQSELITEGREIPAALLVVEGWAARVRILADGRRQFPVVPAARRHDRDVPPRTAAGRVDGGRDHPAQDLPPARWR
jgi:predicted short-subunit dehydrogenase-like oxidoreductase (DUF2520 family)